MFKLQGKFGAIYGLLVIVFTLAFIAVSPSHMYQLLSVVFCALAFTAYQYCGASFSYVLVACMVGVHHFLLIAMQSYRTVSVDVLTPYIINSGFIYSPLLPNPFYALGPLATLTVHFFFYKAEGEWWLVATKVIGTILCGLLSGTVIQFVRGLTLERDRFLKSSITDPLTGVHTFSHMIQCGQNAMDAGHKLTAVLIDLDNYKNINETYGHFIGNKVLIQFAETLRSFMGPEALVGRMGGDEFVILLKTEIESRPAAEILEQMKDKRYITDPDLIPICVVFSYGIAVQTPGEPVTIEQLLTIADKNLFYHKISKKSRQLNCEVNEEIPEPFVDLLNVLSQKDMYTFIHSLYVARYSKALGQLSGLSPLAVDNIALAGWLHDIGKIAIPNEILRKPAQLNDAEYKSIQQHVVYGLNLLRSFAVKSDVIRAIAEHHERYDGTGYPYGKAKEEISIEGRILAIADAYSAMTIKRVYRSHHFSAAEAFCELEKGKEYQFDPVLVERFIAMVVDKNKLKPDVYTKKGLPE